METKKIIKTLRDVQQFNERKAGFINYQDRDELEEMGYLDGYKLTSAGEALLREISNK